MAHEILHGPGVSGSEDDDFKTMGANIVTARGGHYLFPDDYSFRAAGSSLEVLNEDSEVTMVLGAGTWEVAMREGTQVVWVEPEE